MTGTNHLAFDQLLPRIEDAARALTDARCDVVVFHCTANSMEGGKTGEEQILATLARAGAPRATTTITAIQRAFSTLGARRIVLVTPYSASTTEHEAEFLREAGYDIFTFEMRGQGDSTKPTDYEPLQWVTNLDMHANRCKQQPGKLQYQANEQAH